MSYELDGEGRLDRAWYQRPTLISRAQATVDITRWCQDNMVDDGILAALVSQATGRHQGQ